MNWSSRQARCTLVLFLLLLAAGQGKEWLTRTVYPIADLYLTDWPAHGRLLDATALPKRALEIFPAGTTAAAAMHDLGIEGDPLGSGFCMPRAGVLFPAKDGWRIRPMTQRERWVWRIPMDLYGCQPRDLQRIRGIGPSLALRIYRYVQEKGHLDSVSDLDQVEGIGPGKLKALMQELEIP